MYSENRPQSLKFTVENLGLSNGVLSKHQLLNSVVFQYTFEIDK